MPSPDSTWIEYEVAGGGTGDQTLVSRYLTADGERYECERLAIPEGTAGALVAEILKRADQNERTDILRVEVAVNDAIVGARHAAIGRNASPPDGAPDWLPVGVREGGTLR